MARSRIGILGGSFNPVHRRHLQIALGALKELKLHKVFLIPNGNPPHKHTELAQAAHRYEMMRLALIPYEELAISDIEMIRAGIMYTVDTLKILHRRNPNADLFYIIGDDTLFDLENWVQPLEVFKQCTFVVCLRQYQNLADHPYVQALKAKGAVFQFLTLAPQDVSASDIRRQIRDGIFDDSLLTPEVVEYIRVMGLYGCADVPPGGAQAYPLLREDLSEDRLLHSLAVAYTAQRLAKLHGLDVPACELAALLHDCAKCMGLKTMQTIALNENLSLLEAEFHSPGLLHGPVGAALAKTRYGVQRQDVLTAISAHTTGYVGMTAMDMVIFLADKIEPYRDDMPELAQIRALADQNLAQATYRMLLCSKAYVAQTKRPLHPATEDVLRWLKELAHE